MVVKVYILHQHTYRPRTYALTLILLFLFFEISANDQLTVARSSIVGSIVDKNNEGIPFANIFLLSAIDSSFVKGSIADDLGHYSIPDVDPGHYFIECSVIGFSVNQSPAFQVTNENIALNPIQLSESIEELDEVVIEAERPVFEQTIDRMIVNVQSSPIMAGNTVLEILEKSPGVTVDRFSSNVSINGKSGVSVMINGKMTRMEMSALFGMLEGMQSSNIEKIELITTPPANFDAEGNAGFINIVLKKNENEGLNGGVSVWGGSQRKARYSAGGNINYRRRKLNIQSEYYFQNTRREWIWEVSNQAITPGYDFQSNSVNNRSYKDLRSQGRLAIDYDLSDNTVVGILGTFFINDQKSNAVQTAEFEYQPGIDTLVNLDVLGAEKIWQYLANFNLQHIFSEYQQINLDLDYISRYRSQREDFNNQYFSNNQQLFSTDKIDLDGTTPLSILVGKIDYKHKTTGGRQWEFGVKTTLNYLENEVVAGRFENNEWRLDSIFTTYTSMEEDIFAAYSSFNTNFGEDLEFEAGLRYEQTLTDIRNELGQQVVDRNYGNLFPTLYLLKKFSKESSLSLTYSRRITRPSFFDLAAFIGFIDTKTFFTGNTQLFPELTHSYKAAYFIKGASLSFEYSDISNTIARFQPNQIEDTDFTIYTARNLKDRDLFSLNLSLPVNITGWWEMINNINSYYQHIISDYYDDFVDVRVSWVTINSTQKFNLLHDLSFHMNVLYHSGTTNGIQRIDPRWRINLGIRKQLGENGGTLNISASDIFRTWIQTRRMEVPESGFSNVSTFDLDSKGFRITYTNTFGNKKVKSRKRNSGAGEDLQRL